MSSKNVFQRVLTSVLALLIAALGTVVATSMSLTQKKVEANGCYNACHNPGDCNTLPCTYCVMEQPLPQNNTCQEAS